MNNKKNYYLEMQQIIEKATKEYRCKPRLLLHCCCAPCSTHVLELLVKYFKIDLYFYNPNIDDLEEYKLRLHELSRLIRDMGIEDIKIIENKNGYSSGDFNREIAPLRAKSKEGEEPCFMCYKLRLKSAVAEAEAREYDFITTTLSISPMKNAGKLNEIGLELTENCKVKYLVSDFKKKDGYKRSIELSKEYKLYRQDYCGCIFSKKEAELRKLSNNMTEIS